MYVKRMGPGLPCMDTQDWDVDVSNCYPVHACMRRRVM